MLGTLLTVIYLVGIPTSLFLCGVFNAPELAVFCSIWPIAIPIGIGYWIYRAGELLAERFN